MHCYLAADAVCRNKRIEHGQIAFLYCFETYCLRVNSIIPWKYLNIHWYQWMSTLEHNLWDHFGPIQLPSPPHNKNKKKVFSDKKNVSVEICYFHFKWIKNMKLNWKMAVEVSYTTNQVLIKYWKHILLFLDIV